MRGFNFLAKLFEAKPDSYPFVSLYLNTEPNENGKKDFPVFVKKQVSDHLAVLDQGSLERESLEQDAEKIDAFLEDLDPSVRGVAIFASTVGNGFFRTLEFEVPFEENRFYLFDRPFVFPVAKLVDSNPTFAIVAADTNSARITVISRAETIRQEDIQNTKTNRSEVGGWSQMRYQRHIENFHQQHAKEVVAELEKLIRETGLERIILVGDEAVIIPLLRDELSEEMSSKVAGTLSMNVNTPDHEIVEAARELIKEHDQTADKEKMDYLSEMNYEDGVGVIGFEKTLSALFNGQVQELYLSADPDDIMYSLRDVRVLLKNYAPGLDENVPEANEREVMLDELIKRAVASADRIRFIDDQHLLKTGGGVGAILRYQTKGATTI